MAMCFASLLLFRDIPTSGAVVGIVSVYLGFVLSEALPTVSMQITRRFRV